MTDYKQICIIGGGSELAAAYCDKKIIITYNSGDCYRVKKIENNLKNPKIDKTTKFYCEMCAPICNLFVVCRNGNNKIKKGGE